MKTIVIYNSQTGFTKQYAQWISEATSADCIEFSKAKKMNLDEYSTVIFGSWAHAGSISKLSWFKSHIEQWADKKLIAFCVGGSPIESPDIAVAINQWFSEEERQRVNVFYCPGGFKYDIMPLPSKLLMTTFRKIVKAKKDKTDADKAMLKMISSSYDISDKKYIEPILKCLEENN